MKGDLNSRTCLIRNEELTLLSERAIYWRRKKMLLLSDLHLAKSGHFRKAGIPIPSSVHENDLQRLSLLMEKLQPESLCILGDLFHSRQNQEWRSFGQWRRRHSSVSVSLIRGNHDVYDDAVMKDHGLDHVCDSLADPPFFFSHEPSENNAGMLYNMAGHLHPAVMLHGRGRQSGVFPCFWFTKKFSLLPAFGNFTGKAIIQPAQTDRVFIIFGNTVNEIVSSPAK